MAQILKRKEFSWRLKHFMRENNIKQVDIVNASGGHISFANIAHWLDGVYPRHDMLMELFGILKEKSGKEITLDWFMGLKK